MKGFSHLRKNKRVTTTLKSMVVILIFLLAVFGKDVFQAYLPFRIGTPLLKILHAYSWWFFPGALCTGLLFGFSKIGSNLGFSPYPIKAFLFSLVSVSPMLVSSAIVGGFNENLTFLQLLHGTLLAGLMEEFLFRGFLFGLLFRKLGWGFIPAGLIGALIFGWAHLYQGTTVVETLGIFLVTFLGALWFAWLYIEWNNNLWVPIFLHILMNLSWMLFDVGENALGDILTNVFRVATIVITVLMTIRHRKQIGYFTITRKNLWMHAFTK